ncbi:MAG: hypothetical protein NTZ34_03060, partial [Chloroflexi bacterium]|nr:hypothetical protein [Chloroflexota bacterium]
DRFEKRAEQKHSILSKCKDKEIRDAIYNWIDRSVYTIQEQPETDYIYFAFDIRDPEKRPVTIVREKVNPTWIKLLSSVILSDSSEQKFLSLKDTQQTHIIRKLRVEMARFGMPYEGIGSPLKKVTIMDAISLNKPLDEVQLMQRAATVRMGVAILQEVLQLEINDLTANQNPVKKK